MSRELIDLDPRELAAHPSNVRQDLGDLEELTDSIRERGVLQRLILAPMPDAGYRIIAGHRRAAAAIAAELATVPCEVLTELADEPAEQVAAMLIENLQRRELTATEEADGYAQLTAFGWDDTAIARKTGRRLKRVRDALTVVALPDPARALVRNGTLTLEDAAEMAEFADDETLLARLIDQSRWGFQHALADVRRRRDRRLAVDKLREELTAAGVTIVDQPKGYPHHSKEVDVFNLRDADGQTPDPEQVRNQDGFAAFIQSEYGDPRAIIICLDPEASGYRRVFRSGYLTPEEAAQKKAEEEAKAARDEQLRTAAEVRWKFIVATFGNAKAAKTHHVTALRYMLNNGASLIKTDNVDQQIRELTGVDRAALADAGEALLRRFTISSWALAQERTLHHYAQNYYTTPAQQTDALAWLDLLASLDYEFCEAENWLRGQLLEDLADDEPDPDDDPDEDQADEDQADDPDDDGPDDDGPDDDGPDDDGPDDDGPDDDGPDDDYGLDDDADAEAGRDGEAGPSESDDAPAAEAQHGEGTAADSSANNGSDSDRADAPTASTP